MEKYDAIIIGFGKAGKTLAGYLGGKEKKVALIEASEKMYGGTCINVGCIPSKSLVTSALSAKKAQAAAGASPNFALQQKFYAAAIAEKTRLTSMLRQKNFDKAANVPSVTVINGFASFISAKEVEVKTATETFAIEAERIFINTGATPVIPKIKGIEDNPFVYISETMLDLPTLPEKLTIIGGGYIGLEFASIYANFGAKVTVLQDNATFLPREDTDLAAAIKEVLEQKGVEFKLDVAISQIENKGDYADVTYTWQGQQNMLPANAVLIATGRRANTEHLNLAAAGIETNKYGAIKTNELLQTTAPNIWAMGDVAGGLQFTYVSLDDFRIVKRQLEGDTTYNTKVRKNIPYSVFLDPAFSRIGLNEKEALAAGYEIKIAKLPVAAIPKAQVLKHPVGLLKAIIDVKTNKILGVMLFCEESYEMINIIKLAMDLNADYTVLRDQIFTHPTMSEALNDLFTL